MVMRVRRVRRKRRVQSASGRRQPLATARLALYAVAVALGFFLGLSCLTYVPQAYATWRESRLLKRASALLQEQNLEGATAAAQQMLLIRPDSPAAFQILAETTEKQNRAETVAWCAQIARVFPQSLDAQLNLASAAPRFGQLDTAGRALENVALADRDKAAYHVVAGWLARAQGNDPDVERHFAAAVKQEPGNDLYQFNLAVLQVRSSDPERNASARTTLERLSKVVGFRAGSLRALLSDAVQRDELERADGLAQDLQMSQQVTFADLLLCLDFYRKLDEKKFAALLDKVKPVAARNAPDLALLMDWMNRQGLAAEVLKWTDKLSPDLTTIPPASVAIAEALAELKNWSRLRRWTRSGAWGEAEYLRLSYQAYAARQSRQSAADAEFGSLWRSAERATNVHPEREAMLARLATKWNFASEAEQLWLRVSKHAALRREAFDALFQLYRAKNDLPNLYRTAQRLHESSPREPHLAANYARLALLLDQNPAEGHRKAKEAYDNAPANPKCAITYAFSLYGLGRTAEGLEILKKLPENELQDPHAAVYAAVLLLDDNQTAAAQDYIAAARGGTLFIEEKKLLEEAFIKVATASPSPTLDEAPAPAEPEVSPPESPAATESPSPAP